MRKEKLLIFHPALAPYRIDQFNSIAKLFDLEIVFLLKNVPTFKFDQSYLKKQCSFKISYLLTGPKTKNRFFRFGVLKKILKTKPNYIISYEFSLTTQYLIFLKKTGLISQKLGSMIDDNISICKTPQSELRKASRNFVVNKLDFIILLSNDVSSFYENYYNISSDKIIVSPIIQNPDRLRSDKQKLEEIATRYSEQYKLKDKRILLFVGRFTPVKGLVEFIKNIQETIIESTDVKIVLIGEGDEKEEIEKIIKHYDLKEQIILPGRYENIDLYSWYLCASGFILPSKFEPYGAVVNEALIFGTPVMCSELAGSANLINHNNGIIFNPLDKNDTIDNIKIFLDMIKPLSEIDIDEKPSYMWDYTSQFNSEWSKIII